MVSKEIELQLECPLCKDVFREPKTLECLHSFCLECLETHYEKTHSNIGLKCPLCRTPFQYESRDQLANLSTDSFILNTLNTYNSLSNSISQHNNQKLLCSDGENQAVSYYLDCEIYFCKMCAIPHQKAKVSKEHQLIPIEKIKDEDQIKSITRSNPQIYCHTHQQKEMELFCNDCKSSICSLCVNQHSSHKISSLSSVMGNEKQSFINLINKVKPIEKELREGINKCEEVVKQLEINSTTTQTQINQLFNKIRAELDHKEQELLNKLDEIEKYKKKELELQIEELKFGIESIIGSCQMVEHSLSLSTQNDVRLLAMKKLYQSRLDYLSNTIWKTEPCHHPLIEFSISEKEKESIYSNILNVGMVDSSDISAKKCLISRDEKQRIYENKEFKFEITSYSKDGNEMKIGENGNNFKVQVEGELRTKNQNHECEIVDLNNGKYEVKMKLKDEGRYLIFVKYNGIDLVSSPFQIQIFPKQRDYHKITQPKLTFGQFSSSGITTSLNRNIIVSDCDNNQIQIFDSEGKFISTIGSYGTGNGQLNYPKGICVDLHDNIFVCDYNNDRIQILSSNGEYIAQLESCYPSSITIDPKTQDIIVCGDDNQVSIY